MAAKQWAMIGWPVKSKTFSSCLFGAFGEITNRRLRREANTCQCAIKIAFTCWVLTFGRSSDNGRNLVPRLGPPTCTVQDMDDK